MKKIFYIKILLLLAVLQNSYAQSDCNNFVDPLNGYVPLAVGCDENAESSLCYNLDELIESGNKEFRITSFDTPNGTIEGLYGPFNTWDNFAQTLTDLSDGLVIFTYSNNEICADRALEGFGNIEILSQGEVIILYPIYKGIVIPNLDNIINDNPAEDLVIFDGEISLTTSDVVNGGPDPNEDNEVDYSGPSNNQIGNMINLAVSSGALENGISCFNLNCIDLVSAANGIAESPEIAGYLESTDSGLTGQEIEDLIKDELANINVVDFLNEKLGLNIADPGPCPDGGDIVNTPFSSNGKGNVGSSRSEGPSQEADQDYFSGTIAGLGLDGPGTSAPSPSALAMIQSINAGVNLYNGQQSSSVPLHTISANDLSMPISISSTNNGLKVNDMGSLAGQHWNVSAGAQVSRQVKGLPDEFYGITRGEGLGRRYELTPRFEFLSNVGTSIIINGASSACQIPGKETILNGIKIINTDFFVVSWTPLRPNLINSTVKIPIPTGIPLLSVSIDFGFNVGVSLNNKLGEIVYEEHGTGFLNKGEVDADNAFVTAEDANALDIMQEIHAHKGKEDYKFFSDQIANWDNWFQSIKTLLTGERVYETKKLDLEPDEFHYSFGNYSGKFMFDIQGNPVSFPHYPGLKIEVNDKENVLGLKTKITKIKFTTSEGMIYVFGGNGVGPGVDVSTNTNYHLPNFYSYPENQTEDGVPIERRKQFTKPQIAVEQIVYNPWIGPKRIIEFGNTYERNYRKMVDATYTSTWHISSMNSLMTKEKMGFEYGERDIKYYADKSFSHSFPNFDITSNGILKTTKNDELNNFTQNNIGTKWENGRAEFSYSVTEANVRRSHLTKIKTTRGEVVDFIYNAERGEVIGDSLCSEIKVKRDGNLYKGWKLNYEVPEVTTSTIVCGEYIGTEPQETPITIDNEIEFDLGDKYKLKDIEYNAYFFFNISIPCVTIPLRIPFPYLTPIEDWGYTSTLSEFGSLMTVKSLLGELDEVEEEAIFNAEKKRSFLSSIEEIDINNQLHDFIEITYEGDLELLPKKYSVDQDVFGFFNDNSASGSPLPAISYTSISGQTINSNTPGINAQFGFSNISAPLNIHLGQQSNSSLETSKIGAVSSIDFVTGGSVSYTYELNSFPDESTGAGLRVSSLTENPGDSPAKVTNYSYENPTVISDITRIFQTPFDSYYTKYGEWDPISRLEQKVSTSSAAQNPQFMNKSERIGYGEVTETWDGIGSTKHYFTTPNNLNEVYGISPRATQDVVVESGLNWLRRGMECNNTLYEHCRLETFPVDILPPSLRFPVNPNVTKPYLLGVEYKNEVSNGGGVLESRSQSYPRIVRCFEESNGLDPGPDVIDCSPSVTSTKSLVYQYNYPGSYIHNFEWRIITNISPFGLSVLDGLISILIELIAGTIAPHPFKKIDRNYFISAKEIHTNNFRIVRTENTEFFGNLSRNSDTYFQYPEFNRNFLTPHTINTSFSDGSGTVTRNKFVYHPEVTPYLNQQARAHLYSFNYGAPIFSSTEQQEAGSSTFTLIQEDITALKLVGGRIVPSQNHSLMNGTSRLVGEFSNYNIDGKPQEYRLTKYSAGGNSQEFFDPIYLNWNNRLQLNSRTYEGFTESTSYNTYFEPSQQINKDGVVSDYEYDSRRRLALSITQNGRNTTSFSYNVEPGNNTTTTTLSFADGSFPDQITMQKTDGMGKPLTVTRNNDGVLLSSTEYDSFFRPHMQYIIGKGATSISYESSIQPRKIGSTDAVGNTTLVCNNTGEYYSVTETTNPNGHKSFSYSDAIGRTKKATSGGGGSTFYHYDELNRLATIVNPIGEEFTYEYNVMDKPVRIKVPGSELKKIYWDRAFRPIAIKDGVGNIQVFKYDDLNRMLKTYKSNGDLGNPALVYNENGLDEFLDEELLNNVYEKFSFIKSVDTRVLLPDGLGEWKKTLYQNDDLGRPLTTKSILNLDNNIKSNSSFTYSDAGLVLEQENSIVGIEDVISINAFEYDEILRLTDTELTINGINKKVSKLLYDDQDRIKKNLLGQHNGDAYLQSIDYIYDESGRIIYINKPGTTECLLDEEYCEFKGEFKANFVSSPEGLDCSVLQSVIVDGQIYDLFQPLGLSLSINEEFAEIIESALDYYGMEGQATISSSGVPLNYGNFSIIITGSNAEKIELGIGSNCGNVVLKPGDCCIPSQADEIEGLAYSPNPDLYFQKITYSGIDITRIENTALCGNGKNRNDFTYDGDHRILTMSNVVFDPLRQEDRFNTSYAYDAAGNILNLSRNGWISGVDEDAIFGPIDILTYDYSNERLQSVVDQSPDSGQPKGFRPTISEYGYDNNGNVISDNGKKLTSNYNLLNLPGNISIENKGDLNFTYTYDGQKVRKEKAGEDRIYINGVEFVNNKMESYHFRNGRFISDDKFQYFIKDYQGNTVVVFEDKNFDGLIVSDASEVEEEEIEVIQRNSYYPFGLKKEGLNFNSANLELNYLFNGKEHNKEYGIDWSYYGARFYDPSIGRWNSVDPMANNERVLSWSPYQFSYNNPNLFTDNDGRIPLPLITGGIGFLGGAVYGILKGKNWKETLAIATGAGIAGATLGFGTVVVGAAGGAAAIGGAGTSYIYMAFGVAGGFLGNAAKQGIELLSGNKDKFDGEEFVLSGAIGISEALLGPIGGTVKESAKGGLKNFFKRPQRSIIRQEKRKIAKELRKQAGPGKLSKGDAKNAAKKIVDHALEQRALELDATIKVTSDIIDVKITTLKTVGKAGTKEQIKE